MCVIVMIPAGVAIPSEETLRQCWTRNPDGGGVMWQADGKLYYIKGLMTIAAMLRAVAKIPANANAALHFRIGTHGANTAKNTHPWPAGAGRMLMHNGVIHFLADDKAVSDSKRCGEMIANVELFKDIGAQTMLEQAVGRGNKIVLMDAHNCIIINEDSGVWNAGCWYSNYSFQEYRAPPSAWGPLVPLPPIDLRKPIKGSDTVSVFDTQTSFLAEDKDTPVDNGEMIKAVSFLQDGKDTVRITFLCGETSDIPAQEFISLYEGFTYVPALRHDIDRRVAQFAIVLERRKFLKR